MGVIRVDKYFEENHPEIDFMNDIAYKNHHPAFLAKDAWIHPGWGTVEIDQQNQRKVNSNVDGINDRIRGYFRGRRDPVHKKETYFLEKIDLRPVRAEFSENLKIMKAYNDRLRRGMSVETALKEKLEHLERYGVLTQEQLTAIANGQMIGLPDPLEITNVYLREQIEVRNNKIRTINEELGLNLYPIRVNFLDYSNFHKDPSIIERTLWEGQNFRLFYIDAYGFLHLHGLLPFDSETGEIKVFYGGLTGLKALELMQSQVRIFFEGMKTIPDTPEWRKKMWEEIGPILEEVNSWYSDKTKIAKPANLYKFVNAGGMGMLKSSEINNTNSGSSAFADRGVSSGMIYGHNPMGNLRAENDSPTPLPWINPFIEPENTFQILIDWQMSEGYTDQGGLFSIFRRDENGEITGLRAYGYKNMGDKTISDISSDNITVISPAQKEFLLQLSKMEGFAELQRHSLVALANEELDSLPPTLSDFLLDLSEKDLNHPIYSTFTSDENEKKNMQLLLASLARGERLGLSREKKKLMRNMADGNFFMKWFQVKACQLCCSGY